MSIWKRAAVCALLLAAGAVVILIVALWRS